MTDRKIINIVSGKGGTGKTLLTAVLAEMLGNENARVVVVDLDVFVRGLTSLLYFHQKEKLQLTDPDHLTVAQLFIDKGDIEISGKAKLAIERYRSFDVIPSVARVDEILRFTDLAPDSKSEAVSTLKALLSLIPDQYDYIFLDSRAGYDELISATHYISDLSLCIEEEDNISRVTADNLVGQLRDESDTPVLRIVNKGRSVDENARVQQLGLSVVGTIPFDMDVMNSFGTRFFWEDISKTLYKRMAAVAWNNLAEKMSFSHKVEDRRRSPFGFEPLERSLQFFSATDRVFIVYGLLLGFGGLIFPFLDLGYLVDLMRNPEGLRSIASLAIGVGGFTLAVWTLFKRRRS